MRRSGECGVWRNGRGIGEGERWNVGCETRIGRFSGRGGRWRWRWSAPGEIEGWGEIALKGS